MTPARTGAAALDAFHPAVAAWFRHAFPSPTPAQEAAWPLIGERRPVLIAAPTGSGKTLTAFLAAIDALVRDSIAAGGTLPDQTTVVYVSPLKALSNDIRVNLEVPLAGIAEELGRRGLPPHGIRTAVRTGDTTQQDRAAMRKRPPHIVVTTPESLYVLLTSTSGRAMLATTRTVIVDEIHAVAGTKRGSHLALSLARLDALCAQPPARIGLSATQKPLDAVARFLAGTARAGDCAIVDVGHTRQRDLAIELPPVPLEAVMANDVWDLLYDRMAVLAAQHRTTLVFVNTRRMAERAARHLAQRLGEDAVAAHHGSLSKEHRLHAEQRLKRGDLQVLVATASLELGIDIGDVDLVCQVGSPRGISALLQRVGRAGHHVGGVPKGRLFPTSRDDLIECAALLDCVRRGELDLLRIPRAPLDVLAQQIVADVSCREWGEDALYEMVRQAEPYADLPRERFDAVLRMLATGYVGRNGQRGVYVHRDAVARTVRGKRGSQLTAMTSGGTIPDNADYAVVLEPQGLNIGTVNEDFAVESLAGDVFQLGNTSYRILRVETGRVRVEDAHGMAPSIPFWMGEAPGRSDELSAGVARLRERVNALLGGEIAVADARSSTADGARAATAVARAAPIGALADLRGDTPDDLERASAAATAGDRQPVLDRASQALADDIGIDMSSASQIVDYLARGRAALGELPTQDTLILERFFDESGGMQLVLHAPFGSRVNRAWGLALRKRFCRRFNFELQAAATEDAIVISLSDAHSFPLEEVWSYLRAATAEHVLVQAVLDAPLFNVRWRWTAGCALALPRFSGGRKVPPPIQRMRSDDLLAAVFPDQAACLENIQGERDIPDHPLVSQALEDCLHEAMDSDTWLAVLRRIEQGQCRLMARDLPAPSPLAMEILSAKPYAFLDDAPLEERRTHAVMARRWTDPASADDLGALDADAIQRVRDEAWPEPRDADEMHEALNELAFITVAEADARENWNTWLRALAQAGRACRLQVRAPAATGAPAGAGAGAADTASASASILWVALERLGAVLAAYPDARPDPALRPLDDDTAWETDNARVDILRARLGASGPITTGALARLLHWPASAIAIALAQLEAEGSVMRGRFSPGARDEEWCERHLLARIHRYTIKRLRSEVEPVSRQDFMRFLFDWQHLSADARLRGPHALPTILDQLEGYEAPAGAWESELLAARIADYAPDWLDELSRAGKIAWTRLSNPARGAGSRPGAGPVRATPMSILPRRHLRVWQALPHLEDPVEVSARAQLVLTALLDGGAMFFDELAAETRLLPGQLEEVLGELVAAGLIAADSFAGLRALLVPASRRTAHAARRRRGAMPDPLEAAGRWAPVRRPRESALATMSAAIATASGAGAAPKPPRRPAIAPETLEHIARVLLRRYGVVFWRLLDREPGWLPPWREWLPVLHRMEARGEIRGGRFVDGLAGEQFALPEAIPLLREVRRRPVDGTLVRISAVDPLNLCGTLLPRDKVPALAGNRILFRDGLPIATWIARKPHYDHTLEGPEREKLLRVLIAGEAQSLEAEDL
ncbi:ATP-dependent DNA helicase [Bordetella sp. H567]|uniref:DEAD/DEAH box helicase n=1 Tax=Bordetella sp. H567 TaxID=1697043 RepID=UPI00081CB37D|nr:DEAD/DEAH box helicase [Bordetella sp. H567]AOB30903.1 ATP-dependent DNA helicase [Bordetella sp. H567]